MARLNPRGQRLTIYDIMEARGDFAANPANVGSMSDDGSPLYKGPLEWPKMLYHPEGATREVEPERREPSPTGVITIPAKREMITAIAGSQEEEDALREAGWHLHPADAFVAAGLPAPPKGATQVLQEKDHRIAQLERELAAARGGKAPPKGAEA